MSLTKVYAADSTETVDKRITPVMEKVCKRKRCSGKHIIIHNGEWVCKTCGMVQGQSYDIEYNPTQFGCDSNTYKRIFYFNERMSRWGCSEPKIPADILDLIRKEAAKAKYGNVKKNCNRELIGKILRGVVITPELSLKYKSRKFKMQLLTQKRFYDKYFEKWKTIRRTLTGIPPLIPSHQLVEQVKKLFVACQIPFNIYRHHPNCDGRDKCEKYFPCQHNFTNYDYAIRQFLQLCDTMHGFNGSYDTFKNEFPLVSEKVIKNKLRPMFVNICTYNEWPIPVKD